MGRRHECRGPDCPCYKCSMCEGRWVDIKKLKCHQKFSDCRLLLSPEQKLADQQQGEGGGQQKEEADQPNQVPGQQLEGASSTLEENGNGRICHLLVIPPIYILTV